MNEFRDKAIALGRDAARVKSQILNFDARNCILNNESFRESVTAIAFSSLTAAADETWREGRYSIVTFDSPTFSVNLYFEHGGGFIGSTIKFANPASVGHEQGANDWGQFKEISCISALSSYLENLSLIGQADAFLSENQVLVLLPNGVELRYHRATPDDEFYLDSISTTTITSDFSRSLAERTMERLTLP
ncbi:MAG: hypothetical protein R3C09_03485 [Pirellulaceae bacterium]